MFVKKGDPKLLTDLFGIGQTSYFFIDDKVEDEFSFDLCRYDGRNPKDKDLMLDILERKGYEETETFPIKSKEWYQEEDQIYWIEPYTN